MLSNLIWWIIVGLIAGWAAGKIMRGGGYGAVMDIVLGIVGAVSGGCFCALALRWRPDQDMAQSCRDHWCMS